jgi:DNA-binding beta-propeller fold protein YncE
MLGAGNPARPTAPETASMRGPRRLALALALALAPGTPAALADDPTWPGMTPTGQILLPNGWRLDPAGTQVPLGDFPISMAENPKAPVLAVLHAGYGEHEVLTLDTGSDEVLARIPVPETFGGLAWSPDGSRLFVGGGFDDLIYRFDHKDGLLSNRSTIAFHGGDPGGEKPGDDEPLVRAERGSRQAEGTVAGLTLSDDGKTLWVANAFAHDLAKFDAETGKSLGEVDLGDDTYPYAVALDEARGRAYVSLWGASRVAVVEIDSMKVAARWETGPHPNEMLIPPDGRVLYVANANRNTVTVHDLGPGADGRALEVIGTAIHPEAPDGCTPNALALSGDGKALFIANANTNDVAVVNVAEPGRSKPLGFIPAGWYPTSVRVARDGKTLWIANGKGTHSQANREGPSPGRPGGDSKLRQYIGGLFRGTLSVVPMPGPREMAAYSKTVYECSPVDRGDPAKVAGAVEGSPVPSKVGDPSPIKYCIYIIKENRTYDQILGDMPEGNGDPAICLFPEKVTPNHHALARQFVLLDNFYVESEVSADGHEWTMGAYATDFVERAWPLSYRGDRRVPYPSEGSLKIAFPSGGYLWDKAAEKGVSYRSYGEFIGGRGARVPVLEGHFDPEYPGYNLSVTDVSRAERFLEELKRFEAEGAMPRLITMRLPNDHTSGTRVGSRTVEAMLGDNDLALGMVVEGVSKSQFWKETAIFVVEDDAQNGSDHVDAHRTVALAISPYIKRGNVDSTLYTTSSMLRTMELILGLEPMSQFDAAARPMFASFAAEPDLAPYEARPPGVDLKAINAPDAPGAAASAKLDLSREDAADDLVFNEIIWKAVKPSTPMPPPVRAAFVMPHAEDQDDPDEEDER